MVKFGYSPQYISLCIKSQIQNIMVMSISDNGYSEHTEPDYGRYTT